MESPSVKAGKDIPLSMHPLNTRFARTTKFDIIEDQHDSGLDYLVLRSACADNDGEKCDDCDCLFF